MGTVLTVSDILGTPAEYDHELSVRAIGPAVVLILEREAPMRLESLASTESEFDALREWCSESPRIRRLLELYFLLKQDEEGIAHTDLWAHEDEHTGRLQRAQRIETSRVAD